MSGVAVALLVALGASPARADRRVVLLPFKGPAAGQAEAAVTRVVRKQHHVVGTDEFTAAQRRMKATKPTDRNLARVAAKLEVDAVLIGGVERAHGKWRLSVIVREGKSGRAVGTATVRLRSKRIGRGDEKALEAELLPILDGVQPIGGGGQEEEGEEDEDEAHGVAGERRERTEPATVPDQPSVEPEVERTARTVHHGRDAEPDDDVVADRNVRGRGVDLVAGLSLVGRDFSFTVRDGLMNRPNGYQGALVPGAYVVAELYPLAFDPRKGGALRDLGVALVVDKVLKIESKVMGSDEVIPTSQTRWGIGVRYRYNFGHTPTSPSIKVGVGYNRLSFTLDKTAATAAMIDVDLPNVDYTYYDPGVAVRYPFSATLAAVAQAKFLAVTTAGEVQDPAQYGPATVSGFDGDVGLELRVGDKWLVRAGGRYLALAFDFDGTGELSTNRDMDPTSVDVGGALDRYLGGYATVGYLF